MAHSEPQVLQQVSCKDEVQDGDATINHVGGGAWAVASLHGPQVCVLSCTALFESSLDFKVSLSETDLPVSGSPFSLSAAPWVFTKVLAPVMASLRKQGIQIFIYLDDILIVGNNHWEMEWTIQTTLKTLTQTGYIINLKKSDLILVPDLI